MSFAEKTCGAVVKELADKTPVPGGGGASALVGAVGTALGNMVGSFTKGKKKFVNVEDDIIRLQGKCDELQERFLQLMDEDAVLFIPLSQAYALKENTEEERQKKAEVMEKVTLDACKVPLEIMACCCDALDCLSEFLQKGNPMLVSDVGVGALCCKAALQGAAMNVYINTKTMQNREQAEAMNEKTDGMVKEYGEKADLIYERTLRAIS